MNQTNSGQNDLTVQQKLVEAEKILDDYSKSIGTTALKFNNEVETILGLKIDELRRFNEEECGLNAYCLAQYATFIQKEVNRHSAKLKWANHNLDIVVAKVSTNYGDKFTKWEVKRSLVVNDNEFAKALNKIVLEATLRVEELSFISSRIDKMSQILIELQKTRRAEKYERS